MQKQKLSSSSIWTPQLPPFRRHKNKVFGNIIATSSFMYQIGETDLLRQPSKEVPIGKILTSEFQHKTKYLKQCLRKYRKLTGMGRGITAVQAGIPERFSAIVMSKHFMSSRANAKRSHKIASSSFDKLRIPRNDNYSLLVIVNPKITKKSKTLLKYPEMCMSANPIIAPVIRPSWIEFEYYDENGHKQYWDTKDDSKKGRMYNRVFQHEIDHMNGIINIDKVRSQELIFESDPTFYEKAEFEEVKAAEA